MQKLSYETGPNDKKITVSISIGGRDFYYLLAGLNLSFVKSVVDALGICAVN